MKKLLLIGMIIPVLSIAQNSAVLSITRFFPKSDKFAEFEKAAKNHAQKYHTGDYKWRVYTIETGPDAGSYMMVEGASSWEQIDKRGTLGAEHNNDLFKNVLPTVEKTTQMFISFRQDLSSAQQGDYSQKASIIHVFPKVGKWLATENVIKPLKKVWEESKQSVAVYEASGSGPTQYFLVYRYKDGLKERDPGYRKPMNERYDASYGPGSFEKWLASIGESAESSWSEMIYYNEELSSK
jgi:hypothetical protein